LNCNRTSKKTFVYNHINEIPKTIWGELACSNHLYFTPNYLEAIEKNNDHLTFFYIVLTDTKQKAIAFASVQIITFHLDAIENDLSTIVKRVTYLARKFKIIPSEGIFIKNDQNKKTVLRKLAKAILKHTEKNYKERPIDIFIMKDFVSTSLSISNELISLGYYSFNVEPNMKLTIHENWQNFDHYLTSLKTKFRVKAKKALKLSRNLLVKEITVENFDEQVKEMTELYKRVASKADFNLGAFNLATYKSLKEKLGDIYLLKSYWLDHKMVGFMSGMLNENKLDAHFVGIDYELNKSYAIYQRMLYDYIDIAITKKITTLNFGRTASEIKSSVGATPEHLTVYIRHKKSITNKFLKLFLLKIQPTEFHQKFPFKIESKNS